MTLHLILSLCLALLAPQSRAQLQKDIRSVDFRNFSYPWGSAVEDSPGAFRWLPPLGARVQLRDGVHSFDNADCAPRCPWLEIQQITYEDINRDGRLDAMVTLIYNSGGQMYWHVVYIYTMEANTAKLLAAFRTGSRLGEGLHRAYIGNGHLIIELSDDRESEGECCATWRKRTEYEWRAGHFVAVGDSVLEQIPIHERDWSTAP